MKPEKQITLQGCTTAFEMWGRILTEYAQVSAENEPLLWGQFYACKFEKGILFNDRFIELWLNVNTVC
jgi:hypothetical protein